MLRNKKKFNELHKFVQIPYNNTCSGYFRMIFHYHCLRNNIVKKILLLVARYLRKWVKEVSTDVQSETLQHPNFVHIIVSGTWKEGHVTIVSTRNSGRFYRRRIQCCLKFCSKERVKSWTDTCLFREKNAA